MKNLANCTPTEFLVQTNRIKKSLEKWLTDTNFKGIRARMPEVDQIPPTATAEERKAVIDGNKKKLREQALKNLSDILDAALADHPKETLELLALLCFVDPKKVDDHPMREYLLALTELINDEAVIGFFASFLRLGQMAIGNV